MSRNKIIKYFVWYLAILALFYAIFMSGGVYSCLISGGDKFSNFYCYNIDYFCVSEDIAEVDGYYVSVENLMIKNDSGGFEYVRS